MAGGGSKPGERRGGRKTGTLNRKTQELYERTIAAGAGGLLPADMIIAVTRDAYARWQDETTPATEKPLWGQRVVEYAAKAAPYFHPTMKSVEAGGADGGPLLVQWLQEDDG